MEQEQGSCSPVTVTDSVPVPVTDPDPVPVAPYGR